MVVVILLLAAITCVVWWQDIRTARIAEAKAPTADVKLEDAEEEVHNIGNLKGNPGPGVSGPQI
jgi:hypothetical protein